MEESDSSSSPEVKKFEKSIVRPKKRNVKRDDTSRSIILEKIRSDQDGNNESFVKYNFPALFSSESLRDLEKRGMNMMSSCLYETFFF